jgi:hemerythrin-like domain-containing protein
MSIERRSFVAVSTAVGAQWILGACRSSSAETGSQSNSQTAQRSALAPAPSGKFGEPEGSEGDVTAAEDLMREHGVIRRAIIVYREMATRLRAKADTVPSDALHKTAMLFRSFGEDYHERKLEEGRLFPALKRVSSPASDYIDVLVAQHQRGREITDYILAATLTPNLRSGAGALASGLDAFARMYEAHAAREDTVVFPAWKKTMSKKQLDEMGHEFEEIERATFDKDGFDDAVQQISAIEASLDLANLATFTAPPPPKST